MTKNIESKVCSSSLFILYQDLIINHDGRKLVIEYIPFRCLPYLHEAPKLLRVNPLLGHVLLLGLVHLLGNVGQVHRGEVLSLQQVVEAMLTTQQPILLL